MMSKSRWQDKLKDAIRSSKKNDTSLKIAVVGIGHELRGDDWAGVAVARRLKSSNNVFIVDAGCAPENVTGCVRRFGPEFVLLIDAVQMNGEPGDIQWISLDQITGLSASTHSLPVDMFARFLAFDIGCDVALIGIQPANTELGSALSPQVKHAAHKLARQLNRLFGAEFQSTISPPPVFETNQM
jgi:hydrogenase maturation protease HycI